MNIGVLSCSLSTTLAITSYRQAYAFAFAKLVPLPPVSAQKDTLLFLLTNQYSFKLKVFRKRKKRKRPVRIVEMKYLDATSRPVVENYTHVSRCKRADDH